MTSRENKQVTGCFFYFTAVIYNCYVTNLTVHEGNIIDLLLLNDRLDLILQGDIFINLVTNLIYYC